MALPTSLLVLPTMLNLFQIRNNTGGVGLVTSVFRLTLARPTFGRDRKPKIFITKPNRSQPDVSNGNKLVIVGRTSKEVGRAKHELARSYWHVLACVCIFPLGNAYSVNCMCAVTQFAIALLLNNNTFYHFGKG